MALDIYNVHTIENIGGISHKNAKANPYVRFLDKVTERVDGHLVIVEDRPPVSCQKGMFYSDGGQRIKRDEVPDWVWSKARMMSKEGREKVKLVLPEDMPSTEPVEERTSELPPINQPSTLLNVVDAVYSLDHENDGYWTRDDLPALPIIRHLVGRAISRAEVEQSCPGYVRQKD